MPTGFVHGETCHETHDKVYILIRFRKIRNASFILHPLALFVAPRKKCISPLGKLDWGVLIWCL